MHKKASMKSMMARTGFVPAMVQPAMTRGIITIKKMKFMTRYLAWSSILSNSEYRLPSKKERKELSVRFLFTSSDPSLPRDRPPDR